MEYYVILERNQTFERYNIFDHAIVQETVEKLKDLYYNNNIDRKQLIEKLDRLFHYCFWSKCEYELIISQWPNPRNNPGEKIDVYYQLEKNIPLIADSLIAEWRN